MLDQFFNIYSRMDRGNWRHESRGLKVGDVVHYKGQRRRYVVGAVEQTGGMSLFALSGGPKGSNPTAVLPEEIVKTDEPVKFVGKKGEWLLRRARASIRQHQQLGSAPSGSLVLAQQWQVEGKEPVPEAIQEASEIEEVPKSHKELNSLIEGLLHTKVRTIWDGVHGIILEYGHGGNWPPPRIPKAKLAKLASHKQFRWMDIHKDGISIGC